MKGKWIPPRSLLVDCFVSLLLVVGLGSWRPSQVHAATCNVCGCEDCRVGEELAVVRYPHPTEAGKTLQNNCQSLSILASNKDNPFSQAQCDELYTYVTPICDCFYPNGTDVPAYGANPDVKIENDLEEDLDEFQDQPYGEPSRPNMGTGVDITVHSGGNSNRQAFWGKESLLFVYKIAFGFLVLQLVP
ncbi:hypothetical protein ACA910_007862 [Epithemia clementina (nom. ined.)]